jgi:hypothetical protein
LRNARFVPACFADAIAAFSRARITSAGSSSG